MGYAVDVGQRGRQDKEQEMTNLAAATYKLTSGDLYGLDTGELREHLAAYVAANHLDDYANRIIWNIAAEIDATHEHVLLCLVEDLEAMGVEV
jgi:hypothetical protein